MSLDIYLMELQLTEVFNVNITHNLARMAKEAGIYKHLWRPEELGIIQASQLVEPLKAGLELMERDPKRFKKFNPSNGWGTYGGFITCIKHYIKKCGEFPNAKIEVSR